MSGLTLAELQDLSAKLTKLGKINDEQERASTARREASDRWNAAREEYARLYGEIVTQYGDDNAPRWVEVLRGPRPVPLRNEPPHE